MFGSKVFDTRVMVLPKSGDCVKPLAEVDTNIAGSCNMVNSKIEYIFKPVPVGVDSVALFFNVNEQFQSINKIKC